MVSRAEQVVLRMLRARSYPLTVAAVEDVTEHYRRVHFTAPELLAAHETPPAFWLRLWIPDRGRQYQRAYTVTDVRRDQARFAVEFVLHQPDGVGSDWARAASPGATVRATVFGSKRFTVPKPRPAGYLLLGDPSSLAAINDVLRALPAELPARVLLHPQHPDDPSLPVRARPGDKVSWVAPHLAGLDLAPAIRHLSGEVAGWAAWVATETTATKRLRSLLRQRYGLARAAVTAQANWIRGRSMGRPRRATGRDPGGPR